MKNILGAAVGLGALSLVSRSASMIGKKGKDLTKGFRDLVVGTALLVPTAGLIGKLK
jgi:hypothetical protein